MNRGSFPTAPPPDRLSCNQAFADILLNDHSPMMDSWRKTQEHLSREQAEEFLSLLSRAVLSGKSPDAQIAEWMPAVKSLLKSNAKCGEGLLPSEATQPLRELKEPLFAAIRHAYPETGSQTRIIQHAASLLDDFGLLVADAVHTDALQQERAAHQQVEVALINTKEFKERIVESSPDCLKVLDADARLMWMSEHGKQLMEVCEFGQIRGASWIEFWAGAAQGDAQRAITDAKAGKIGRFEGPCLTLCGTPKWWNVVVAPILDEQGRVAQLLSVSRDITEQKRIETELREREAELEQAVSFRENLLAVVSHDLRGPLSVIDLNVAMLQKNADTDWAAKRLTAVEHAADRMAHLINDLLDMAGIQAGRLSVNAAPQEIGELLHEAVAMQQPLAEDKGIQLEVLATEPVSVLCDRERMLQVAGNLIGNAIKFCQAGDAINVRVSANDEIVQFDVEDTGPGIALADVPHVFDVYWSAQKDKAGAGLGLFICKGIIEAHGGRIWAESPPGAGASFSVELPRRI